MCPHSIPKNLHRVPSTPAMYSVAQICAYHWTKRALGEMELDAMVQSHHEASPFKAKMFFIFSSNPISLSFHHSRLCPTSIARLWSAGSVPEIPSAISSS